jgi:hypothetical protein
LENDRSLQMGTMMDLTDEEAQLIRGKIEALKVEHRDLDDIIERLARDPNLDELQIRRLKRRKLLLKDQIALLESQLVPDIPA